MQRYRFDRETIKYSSGLMRGDLKRLANKETALSMTQQVMMALIFYGSGSHLQVVGDTMDLTKINCVLDDRPCDGVRYQILFWWLIVGINTCDSMTSFIKQSQLK